MLNLSVWKDGEVKELMMIQNASGVPLVWGNREYSFWNVLFQTRIAYIINECHPVPHLPSQDTYNYNNVQLPA